MIRLFLPLLLFVISACAGAPTPIPDAESEEGKIFSARCGVCHVIPHPKRHNYGQWEHLITVMEKEMEHKKMAPLKEEDRAAILEYLKAHSR